MAFRYCELHKFVSCLLEAYSLVGETNVNQIVMKVQGANSPSTPTVRGVRLVTFVHGLGHAWEVRLPWHQSLCSVTFKATQLPKAMNNDVSHSSSFLEKVAMGNYYHKAHRREFLKLLFGSPFPTQSSLHSCSEFHSLSPASLWRFSQTPGLFSGKEIWPLLPSQEHSVYILNSEFVNCQMNVQTASSKQSHVFAFCKVKMILNCSGWPRKPRILTLSSSPSPRAGNKLLPWSIWDHLISCLGLLVW